MSYDYEAEYFLKPFEVEMIKDHAKTIVIVPDGVKFNTIIHMNGLAAKVVRKFKKSLRKLSKEEAKKFGVKWGTIPASCDHPEFEVQYYGNTMSSDVYGTYDAFKFYIEENPDRGWNIDKPYNMVEFELHHSSIKK